MREHEIVALLQQVLKQDPQVDLGMASRAFGPVAAQGARMPPPPPQTLL
tara:strand:+ start:2336 stop:2482 length:147 start_codon:yes stop_codon:yes gene_type:complete